MKDMTITEFLTARLDESEQYALAHTHMAFTGTNEHTAQAGDPRVLADIAAKRRIVARHEPELVQVLRTIVDGKWLDEKAWECIYCAGLCHSQTGLYCADDGLDAPYPCPDIKDLASVYADHPDYQQEWRP
jgi:rubrerythrin